MCSSITALIVPNYISDLLVSNFNYSFHLRAKYNTWHIVGTLYVYDKQELYKSTLYVDLMNEVKVYTGKQISKI